MDLIEFLRARLDEDEREAEKVHEVTNCECIETALDRCDCGWPARVLREVAAKRAILNECQAVTKLTDLTGTDPGGYRDWMLRQLAAVYSDHPDYRAEWKP